MARRVRGARGRACASRSSRSSCWCSAWGCRSGPRAWCGPRRRGRPARSGTSCWSRTSGRRRRGRLREEPQGRREEGRRQGRGQEGRRPEGRREEGRRRPVPGARPDRGGLGERVRRHLEGRARRATSSPGGDFSGGSYSFSCTLSDHHNSDNPIIAPGKRNGAQHVHDYAGNDSTNAASNLQVLKESSTTCTNGDQSPIFWPVLRDLRQVGPDVGQDGGSLDGNVGAYRRADRRSTTPSTGTAPAPWSRCR